MPEQLYDNKIDPFVNAHFDGNLSHAIRASLLSEQERRDENVDTMELKIMRNKLESIDQRFKDIGNELDEIAGDSELGNLGVDETARLTNAALDSNGDYSPMTPTQIADILRDADQALTIGSIASRSNFELGELHGVIEKLLNTGVIEAVSTSSGEYKYRISDLRFGE